MTSANSVASSLSATTSNGGRPSLRIVSSAPIGEAEAKQTGIETGAQLAFATPKGENAFAIAAPVLQSRKIRVFGLQLTDTTLTEAAKWIVASAEMGARSKIAFVNAHSINTMYSNAAFRSALQSVDTLFADGSGIGLAVRAAGTRVKDNVNGTDLFPILCNESARTGTRVFLLGGRQGLAARTLLSMANAYPGLAVAGSHHGYFASDTEEQVVIDMINASKAQIVLVGLGSPLQELWVESNCHRLNAPVLISVGGLFDYYSGRIPRAPRIMRSTGIEWVWRLTMEPRRLAKRYVVGNVAFLARLAWSRGFSSNNFGTSAAA